MTRPVLPVLKWVGGKGRLLDKIRPHVPTRFNRIIEPFAGGASFSLAFGGTNTPVILADANPQLIGGYLGLRESVEDVIAYLDELPDCPFLFAQLRDRDWTGLPLWEQAARMLYLNATCFKGLWRENKAGKFNASYFRPKSQRVILRPDRLRAFSRAIQHWDIACADFKTTLKQARKGDLVFLDPPYHQTFDCYSASGFSEDDQRAVAAEAIRLKNEVGCHVIVNNSDTEFVRGLYSADFDLGMIAVPVNVRSDLHLAPRQDLLFSASNDEFLQEMAA